ncbi:hypothetical protein BESEP2_00088 [Staphylococcus phage vB_SepS_BE02]|nr:hypothetical protein BESEP2_00088 [Staphylococcus phage vB_SepS_BE02]
MDIQENINDVLDERIVLHEYILNKRKNDKKYDKFSIIVEEQRLIEVKLMKELINDKFKEYRGEF